VTLLGYIYGGLGGLTLGVSLASWYIKRRPHADPSPVYASLGICALWLLYVNIKALQLPDTFVFNAVMDLAAVFAVMRLYRRQRAVWKIVLAFAFLAQLCLHVVYGGLSDRSPLTQWRYSTGLDVFYIIQLLAIFTPGGSRGLRYLHSVLDSRRVASKAVARR